MAGPLVAGYESESGSEDEAAIPITTNAVVEPSLPSAPSASGSSFSSKLGLPPATHASALSAPSSSTGSSGLSLSPPRNGGGASRPRSAAKRKAEASKFQIRIESLDHPAGDDALSGDDGQPEKKRPKSAASGPMHALFGLLPAPKRANEVKREKKAEAEKKAREGALQIVALDDGGDEEHGEGGAPADLDNIGGAKKGGKGNADFRAMLGLKPAASKPKPKGNSAPVLTKSPAASSSVTPAAIPSKSANKKDDAAIDAAGMVATAAPNFFSLDDGGGKPVAAPAPALVASHAYFAAKQPQAPGFTISAAPTIDEAAGERAIAGAHAGDDQDGTAYRGWQQDPDGTWVPVTPEAQTAYAEWQVSQQNEAQMARTFDDPSRRRHNNGSGAGGFDIGELAKAGIREEDLSAVDAASLTTWNGAGASASGLDARYASAAAESALGATDGPATTNRKTDKMTGQKARQKGQLTSLLAHAEEKRGQLEEKWARGKLKGQASASKYGFR